MFTPDDPNAQPAQNSSSGPVYHPQGWIGNRNYKELFEAMDRALERERATGAPSRINLRQAPTITEDPGLNPRSVPDSRGLSPTGWNRVAEGSMYGNLWDIFR